MTTVWRIAARRLASEAFSGEGAFLYGGRWNPRGIRVVYAAQSLALAALEQLVHLQGGALGLDYLYFRVDIPDSVKIRELDAAHLPKDWRVAQGLSAARELGWRWAQKNETAVMRVPSILIPLEHNYLLNPGHPQFKDLRVHRPEPFSFDPRLAK